MKADWKVTIYDSFENPIDSWVIKNRTVREADKEAMASPEVRDCHDWSIAKVQPKEVTIVFTGSMTVAEEFLDIREGQILDLGDVINNAERVAFNGEIHAANGVTIPPESVEYRID